MNCLDPDLLLPFIGYRRLEAEHRLHDLAPSLSHFYESEKLRGTNEELRQDVLLSPTARAARKLTRRHQKAWRDDWKQMRARVLAAGLIMQMMQSKQAREMAYTTAAHANENALSSARVAGMPVPFVSNVTSRVVVAAKDKNAVRLGFVTLRRSVPVDLADRLDALFLAGLPLTATVYVGNDSAHLAEEWCMARAVPLRYLGDGSLRFRAEEQKALLRTTRTLIICAPQSRGEVAQFLALAKSARRKVIDLTRPASDLLDD